MRSRIASVWNEFVERPMLDALRHGMREHTYPPKLILGSFRRVRFALACRTEPMWLFYDLSGFFVNVKSGVEGAADVLPLTLPLS